MKFSQCMTVLSVSLALAATGCRYNKAGSGSGADEDAGRMTDINAATDLNAEISSTDTMGGSLGDLVNAGKTFAERGYTRCTDVDFAPVYFGFDATSIRPEELAKVEAVAQHLLANPDRVVSIEGNCDERGSNEYNLSLGDDRAIIISNYLTHNGIANNRIETVSRGETNPAVAGSGEGAWSKNRRGEFIILKK